MVNTMPMYGGKDLEIPDDFTDSGLPSRGVFSASQHGCTTDVPGSTIIDIS